MLDVKYIKENKDYVIDSVKKKHLDNEVDVNKILELDTQYIALLQKVEIHRNLRNELSQNISKLSGDARDKQIQEASRVKEELKDMEQEMTDLKMHLNQLLLKVPNVIAEDVPYGKDESENVVLRSWGTPTKFDFEPKDHVALGESLDLIDIETSAKVSGSRFNYLKNEAVLLQFALINYVFEILTDEKVIKKLAGDAGLENFKTFTPILPPVLVNADVAKKMDRYDPIEDRYYYDEDDILLVGSAEHTLGPMYMDQVLNEQDLPIRLIGYSTAFRREAGSYGRDTTGIFRRHQFDKLEMEIFSTKETGQLEQDFIVAIQEHILQGLEIPYQVMMLCTGDMGKPDYRQIDINSWMPGYDAYRETHTSDYMTDFQSRRLNTRYKDSDGNHSYVYMNDATALALGRILIAILENYQNKDGSVSVPKVLQKYTGFKKITKKENN